jgi:hypothetical protein
LSTLAGFGFCTWTPWRLPQVFFFLELGPL